MLVKQFRIQGQKLWDILSEKVQKDESRQDLKKKKNFGLRYIVCELCKTYIANVGYV